MEILGEDREEKMVAYFVGKQKGLVLNLTNYNTISRICGSDETDDWAGQEIVLATELVTFRGLTAPAIRVRAPATRPSGQRGERGIVGGSGGVEF
jgi:hypothetical protein